MKSAVKAYALFTPELKELIQQKNYSELKAGLKQINAVDLAEGWKEYSPEQQVIVFKLLDNKKATAVFEEVDVDDQIFLLSTIGEDATSLLLEELPPGETSHLFRRLPKKLIKKLSNMVKREETVTRLQKSLTYPPSSAGSLMHTDIILMKKTMTASQALETVRSLTKTKAHDEGLLNMLYVTDTEGRLIGGASLQSLVAAPRDLKLTEIMSPVQLFKIPVTLDQEEAAKMFSKYNLVSAPVVDEENRLVGVMLVDDMMEVVQSEATEDITKMVGATPQALETRSIWKLTQIRMPWLVVTLGVQILVSMIIRHHEGVLIHVLALASFMPLIAALGGNVGSQSATIVVRGIAMGEFQVGDQWKTVFREAMVGWLMGSAYALVMGAIAYGLYGAQHGFYFAFVVATGVVVSMTIAATMGALGPFIFHKFNIDPATVAGPFITTTTDLISVSSYLILATALLLK